MAILNELRALFLIILKIIQDFFDGQALIVKRYVRHISIGFIILLVALSGYMGYRWYIVSREQNAHYAIADYIHDYHRAIKSDNATDWQRVNESLSLGYAQHKNSNIAPFFLLLRADVLLRQDNAIEAINILQNAIQSLPASSPIMPLFKTKRALILLDSADEAMQKEGLENLVQLARDKDNAYNDIALFYLGRYYWVHDNVQDAQKAWQELVDNNAMEKTYTSPWVHEAQRALKQITQ